MNLYTLFLTLSTIALVSATACTWVKPKEGAEEVALVKTAHVENCDSLGVATASVKHKVAGLKRKSDKVSEELLTLAKNEAASMGGDTLVSLSAPEEGSQRFQVYRCK